MDGAFRLVMVMTLALVAVIGLSVVRGALRPSATAEATPTAPAGVTFLYPDPQPAPPLALTDQDGAPFSAGRFVGGPTLLFFGYTHCPGQCPTDTLHSLVVAQVIHHGEADPLYFVSCHLSSCLSSRLIFPSSNRCCKASCRPVSCQYPMLVTMSLR